MKKKFKAFRIYLTVHESQRKIIILMTLITFWCVLLIGALFSPNRQIYTAEQVSTEKSFENGTGEINLVSQKYSEENKILMLQFETKDSTSAVDLGINNDNLKWELFSPDKELKSEMEVIPVIDNKITVVIKNVPDNFKVLAILITNSEVDTSSLKTEAKSSEEIDSGKSSSDTKEDNVLQFFVTPRSGKIKNTKIDNLSREDFVISALTNELNYQHSEINQLNQSKKSLQKAIKNNDDKIDTLNQKGDYLTGRDKENNDSDIETIRSDIQSKKDQIDQIDSSIKETENRIDGIQKNIDDVNNGSYDFKNKIKSAKLN